MVWALRFFTSRLGLVIVVGAALLAWHRIDKGSAVRAAVVDYVAGVELQAAEAEAAALRARIKTLNDANEIMAADLAEAERETEIAEAARMAYLARRPDPPGACVVDDDLLGVLRR